MSLLQLFLYKGAQLVGGMTWIRWGLRYKVFSCLAPLNVEFSLPFYGQTYRGNFNNFIDRVVYVFGAHERQVMEYCGTLLAKESVVLDVGANVGHHALFYATKAKTVHAFEPNAAFRPQFEMLMRTNTIANVELHPFALGDKTHEAPYYAPTGDNRGVGSFVETHDRSNERVGTMSIVEGDDVVAALSLARIDLIKIDVEGYEESVLRGLTKTLQRYKPIVVMEYTQGDFSSVESFRALTEGYTPYLLRANTAVGGLFNDPHCKRAAFQFDRAHGEVLLVPDGSEL